MEETLQSKIKHRHYDILDKDMPIFKLAILHVAMWLNLQLVQ